MTSWDQVRAEFPALTRWTFLNTATFGQLPRRATEAVARHFARRDEHACADFLEWFDDADANRALAARLIHCEPSDIAFIPNASTALSLLLRGIRWKTGDQILTLEREFPNHYYFPSHLRALGVEVVEAPWERFYSSITPRTRLAAFSTVNYSTGFRPPLEEISAELRRRGILLYLDGTQSLGALQFDTRAVQPDLFAVHGYKWLISPNGAGFMYVSPELRERLEPAVIGWRSHRGWRHTDSLHHGLPEFKSEAEKYEGGMLTFTVLYAMGASIELLLEIGPEQIEARVLRLAQCVRQIMQSAGGRPLPHSGSSIVVARFPKDGLQLVSSLRAQGVQVAARYGNLRVSPHFYNDESDLDRFAEALERSL